MPHPTTVRLTCIRCHDEPESTTAAFGPHLWTLEFRPVAHGDMLPPPRLGAGTVLYLHSQGGADTDGVSAAVPA